MPSSDAALRAGFDAALEALRKCDQSQDFLHEDNSLEMMHKIISACRAASWFVSSTDVARVVSSAIYADAFGVGGDDISPISRAGEVIMNAVSAFCLIDRASAFVMAADPEMEEADGERTRWDMERIEDEILHATERAYFGFDVMQSDIDRAMQAMADCEKLKT